MANIDNFIIYSDFTLLWILLTTPYFYKSKESKTNFESLHIDTFIIFHFTFIDECQCN